MGMEQWFFDQPFGRIFVRTELLNVSGMTCGGCSSKVTRALESVRGVHSVSVSLSPGNATVQYDERLTSPGQLDAAVRSAGYSVDAIYTASNDKSKGCCS